MPGLRVHRQRLEVVLQPDRDTVPLDRIGPVFGMRRGAAAETAGQAEGQGMIVISTTVPELFRLYGTTGLTVAATETGWLEAAVFCLGKLTQEELERLRRVINNPLTVAKDTDVNEMGGL